MPKDPKRWTETIIDSPFAKLTKQDVYDYYKTPAVQKRILDSVAGRNVLVRQSFTPTNIVLKRKEKGQYIRPSDIKDLIERRLTEVHPVFGKKTDRLVVDIDPQKNVPWNKTKSISELVAKTLQSHPDIKNVNARFSGNRGFLLEGLLKKEMGINAARNRAKEILDGVTKRDDVTFGVAKKPDQIRIDLSPLKFRGSYKAPFSLDSRTGLVAAPVKIENIPNVNKKDFTVKKILDKVAAKKEFAPGIPLKKLIQSIPTVKKPEDWQLAVQKHDAHRAGKHWDLRFVPKGSNRAHSFTVPKSRFPTKKDHPFILALEQPTHTKHYALSFSGEIPEGTYGAGKVDLLTKEKIKVIKANADRLVFERKDGKQRFSLFRTDGNRFGLKRIS